MNVNFLSFSPLVSPHIFILKQIYLYQQNSTRYISENKCEEKKDNARVRLSHARSSGPLRAYRYRLRSCLLCPLLTDFWRRVPSLPYSALAYFSARACRPRAASEIFYPCVTPSLTREYRRFEAPHPAE